MTDAASIGRLAEFIGQQFGRLDILVNNAGVFMDRSAADEASALRSDPAVVRQTFERTHSAP